MSDIPITSSVSMNDFWQVKTVAVEWLFVLSKLAKSVQPAAGDQHVMLGVYPDNSTMYLLKKSYYPSSTLSKAFGIPVEKLDTYQGIIKLNAPKQEATKEPNVDYWGET